LVKDHWELIYSVLKRLKRKPIEEALPEYKDHVWSYNLMMARLVCVVGDVCLSRRKFGRHVVVPLHSDIAVICRKIGFDNLNPIIWHKISNANYEVSNGTKFLGKPYEPNAIIKNDIEFILMERKPGGYRQPTTKQRQLSMISKEEFAEWFRQFWTLTGASTKVHPAPFPLELAHRLVRMFSFWGDTVLDPFCGTATTMLAAIKCGRDSIGIEIDPEYCQLAAKRLQQETGYMYSTLKLEFLKSVTDSHGALAVRETSADYSTRQHKTRKTSAQDTKHSARQDRNKVTQRRKQRP
jgi:DNA modification methylase